MSTWGSGYMDDPARQCHGKRTYATHQEAKAAMVRQKGTGGGLISKYRCLHCGRIHLGHPPSGRRARKDHAA